MTALIITLKKVTTCISFFLLQETCQGDVLVHRMYILSPADIANVDSMGTNSSDIYSV
jgi:hypothetical protein